MVNWVKMKNTMSYLLVILLLFLPVILYTKKICDEEDNRKIAEVEKIETEKRFEEVEKRIRILEQDNYILKYGYENEKE